MKINWLLAEEKFMIWCDANCIGNVGDRIIVLNSRSIGWCCEFVGCNARQLRRIIGSFCNKNTLVYVGSNTYKIYFMPFFVNAEYY